MLRVILLQDQRTAESNFADYESETAEFLTPFIAMYNQVGEKKFELILTLEALIYICITIHDKAFQSSH